MTRAVTGKPPGKPRGKSFEPGVCPNPKGRPKASEQRRREERDARLLARDHSVEAVEKMIHILRKGKTQNLQLAAANMIVDRGYGRPPQALEVYGGDVRPEEREGSALEIITSKLAELGRRERDKEGVKLLN